MFYQFWKFKRDTLIFNHFIINYILYGMVTRRSLRRVPWRSKTSLFFIVTFYTLRHFWLSTQKSNTNFNNLFYMNIKFDKPLSEIVNVLQKGEFKLTKSALYNQSVQFFLHSRNATQQIIKSFSSHIIYFQCHWDNFYQLFEELYIFSVIMDPFQTSFLAHSLLNWKLKFMEMTECLQNCAAWSYHCLQKHW